MPVSYGFPIPPRLQLVDFLQDKGYRAFRRGSVVTFFSLDPLRGKPTRFLLFFKGEPKLRLIGSIEFETECDWSLEYSGDDLAQEVVDISRAISREFPSIGIHTLRLSSQPVFQNK